jgi:diguanylate cyclase (GGDEF)-like protein
MIPLASNEPEVAARTGQVASDEEQAATSHGEAASSEGQTVSRELRPRVARRPVLIWRLALALPTRASKRLAGQGWLASPEHTSLEQRLGTLQAVRMTIVALAFIAAAAVPRELGMTVGRVLPISLGYLAICLASQALDHRRLARSGSLGAASLEAVRVHTAGVRRGPPAHVAPVAAVRAPTGSPAGAREHRDRREDRPELALHRDMRARDSAKRSRAPVQQMLLPIDSLYLAVLMVPSGGAQSDFLLLFAVQLVAVTLLASPRTGIRVALWDSALLLAVNVLRLGGPVATFLGVSQLASPPLEAVGVRIMGFWAVALSTAYFSALSERELRRSKAQLDALTTMASEMERSMEASTDGEEVAEILLRSMLSAFGFKQAAAVWERKGRTSAIKVLRGGQGALVCQEIQPVARGALVGEVAARALNLKSPVLARRLSPVGDPVLEGMVPGAVNVVVVPLKAGGERLGLVVCEAGPPVSRRFSRRSVAMVGRFAAHAALTMKNADLNSEVARLAASDGLTGLANRREFTAVLAKEVARAARSKDPLSLAVLDVDHFKVVNDTFGHLAGDEVLREVARAMTTQVREVDLVARYGGEEFAIILPNCSSMDALAVVERVRAAIEIAGTTARVTASAGIASMPGDSTDEEGLMAAADQALYRAKDAGRDRVVLAGLDLSGFSPAKGW